MADKKISALTSASTPLASTEVLPIVQSGATVKVAVSDLTAGRAISATQLTLTTGNLIVANGQGVDFSATSGTGTSELFADYEEGTWTPANPQVTLSITSAVYTKIGRCVNFECRVAWPANVDATQASITGLPFTPSGQDYPVLVYSNSGSGASALIPGSAVINIVTINQSAVITNASLAGVTLRITGFYFV